MKFWLAFHKTPLFIAVEKENVDIVLLLLECQNIDTNIVCVLDDYFNKISNLLFKYNFILIILM